MIKAATLAAKVLLAMLNSSLLKFHPFHSLIGARGIYFDLSGADLRIYANYNPYFVFCISRFYGKCL